MYAVVRRYRDRAVLDAVVAHRAEVEAILRSVPGFVAYYMLHAGDGGESISIYQDQAGTAESTRRAREWVLQHVPAAAAAPPEVTEGALVLTF